MDFIQVLGHLAADPETRVSPDGTKRTTFRVADNIRRKDADETVWWNVTVWGDRFDRMMPYVKKGSAVVVNGSLSGKPEIWTDKNGAPQVSLNLRADIINFSPFGAPAERSPGQQPGNTSTQGNNGSYGNQSSPQARTPYAGNQQVTSGQSQQQNFEQDEEPLPF